MSPAPGVTYTIRDTPPTQSIPQGTSRAFVAGITERGPADRAVKVTSISEFVATFGGFVSYGYLYDVLDVAFREGLSEAWVSRVVGPNPVIATSPLFDVAGSANPADVSILLSAKNAGAWANTITPAVIAGVSSGIRITLTDSVLGLLETSPDLTTRDEIVSWAASSSALVTAALGASAEMPRVQAGTAMTGGTGDHLNATDTEWAAALTDFPADLGGGQVAMPGRTTATSHNAVIAHALANNRTAILDAPDTKTVATLTALAGTGRAQAGAKFAGMFGPWAVAPGRLPGTTRTVPYSAVQIGLIARSDEAGNAPNLAAAGDNGEARYATGLSQTAWTDAERATLNDAGVNVALMKYGRIRTYGYRTLANPMTLPNWVDLGGAREVSFILTKVQELGESFAFDGLDGRRKTIGRWAGAIGVVCSTEYERDALYGDTPADAYLVDAGPSVNTAATIAARKLRVVLALKTSPMAEAVEIEVVKVLTTESLG